MARIAARSLRLRSAQRGQVLLGIVVILGVVSGALFFNSVSPASSSIERDRITNAALAQAKEALIGYAASDPGQPGVLPCPDRDNDGSADSPCGAIGVTAIGRLPWKTLGLPALRDGSGECLWYAVSANFKNSGVSGPSTVNSDSSGTLVVNNAGGTPLYSGSNAVPAIIFAPGSALPGQDRGPSSTAVCGGNTTIANYLEGGNQNGAATSTFVSDQTTTTFNDRLLPVTRDAVMSVVEMRVLRTMRAALVAYRATPGNGYPFANSYGDNANYECAYLQIEGRFPVKMKTLLPSPSGCLLYADWGPELPAWFGNNRWQTVSYYSVDPCKVGPVAGAGGAIVSGLNALCALGLPPKVDGTAKDVVILVGSSALAAVPGQTPRPCGARSACFEAPNLSGNAFVTPTRSFANNDRLVSIP